MDDEDELVNKDIKELLDPTNFVQPDRDSTCADPIFEVKLQTLEKADGTFVDVSELDQRFL